jgi:hypothetical protein
MAVPGLEQPGARNIGHCEDTNIGHRDDTYAQMKSPDNNTSLGIRSRRERGKALMLGPSPHRPLLGDKHWSQ